MVRIMPLNQQNFFSPIQPKFAPALIRAHLCWAGCFAVPVFLTFLKITILQGTYNRVFASIIIGPLHASVAEAQMSYLQLSGKPTSSLTFTRWPAARPTSCVESSPVRREVMNRWLVRNERRQISYVLIFSIVLVFSLVVIAFLHFSMCLQVLPGKSPGLDLFSRILYFTPAHLSNLGYAVSSIPACANSKLPGFWKEQ